MVVTDSADLYEKLFYNPQHYQRAVCHHLIVIQLIRGLKTLSLRMERSTAITQEIMAFLEQSPAVQVLYTGREDDFL